MPFAPTSGEPARLYQLCLELLCPVLEKVGARLDWANISEPGPLDKLGKFNSVCSAKGFQVFEKDYLFSLALFASFDL